MVTDNLDTIARLAPDYYRPGMDRLLDVVFLTGIDGIDAEEHHPRENFDRPNAAEVEHIEWRAREQHFGEVI